MSNEKWRSMNPLFSEVDNFRSSRLFGYFLDVMRYLFYYVRLNIWLLFQQMVAITKLLDMISEGILL